MSTLLMIVLVVLFATADLWTGVLVKSRKQQVPVWATGLPVDCEGSSARRYGDCK